jgi:hypothetical protein
MRGVKGSYPKRIEESRRSAVRKEGRKEGREEDQGKDTAFIS